jgi:hypothetical protein
LTFPLWEAAIAAGATLDDLEKLDRGGYQVDFQARLLAWHSIHNQVEMHRQDAVARAMERKQKAR